MARPRPKAALSPLLALLLLLPAGAAVANGTKAEEPAKPAQPQLTPQQQAANDLLERYRLEARVRKEQQLFLAAQHLKVGKAHFEIGDWKAALPHFQKAVELDPANPEALDYLARTRGMLGLKEGPGKVIDDYIDQRTVAIEMRKLELANTFAQGKALYGKGQYAEALELFIRTKALAEYLAPLVEAGKTAAEADAYKQKAESAIRRQRGEAEKQRLERAKEQTEELRKDRQSLLDGRQRARLEQARSLFEQHRYDQARKACDALLRDEPSNGAALALRETAFQAARNEAIDRVLATRRAEVDRHFDEVAALAAPQNELVHMPLDRFEEVRRRKVKPLFASDQKPPEAWEGRVREALDRKVSFDFVETPLQDVIGFLGTVADVSMIVDTEALKGEALNVTLRVNDMRLGAALNWICKLVGLKYALRNEAIFVSKPERIYDEVVLRMFDVTDLTMEIRNFKGRQRALATDSGWGDESGGGGAAIEDFFPPEDEQEDKGFSGETLIEFIKQLISPGKWGDEKAEPVGLREDGVDGKGRELVDVIGIVVGGRTFMAVKTKE